VVLTVMKIVYQYLWGTFCKKYWDWTKNRILQNAKPSNNCLSLSRTYRLWWKCLMMKMTKERNQTAKFLPAWPYCTQCCNSYLCCPTSDTDWLRQLDVTNLRNDVNIRAVWYAYIADVTDELVTAYCEVSLLRYSLVTLDGMDFRLKYTMCN